MKKLAACLEAVIGAASFACEAKEDKTAPAGWVAPAQPETSKREVGKRDKKGVWIIDDTRMAEKRMERK
jgi:hypothetical protein